MNDTWGYDDNGSGNQPEHNDGSNGLRSYIKSLEEKNNALNEKLTSFLDRESKREIAGVFESMGVPGAASLYQGEPDPAKAREWAETMKATFGGIPQAPDASESVAEQAPALTPEQQAQLQTLNEAGQSGSPMGNIQAAEAAIGSATSLDDLIRISAQTQHLR